VEHSGSTEVCTWALPATRASYAIVGFNVYTGRIRLNRRLILRHHSRLYRFVVQHRRAGQLELGVVLRNGSQHLMLFAGQT
jgi:hypothetical protein